MQSAPFRLFFILNEREVVLSVIILTYALPSGAEPLQRYGRKVPGWIDITLSAPGAKEFRGYRSVDGKEALTITEYESAASAENFLASDKYKALRIELEKAGCRNIQVRKWDASPLVPRPVQARTAAA